MKTTDGNQDQPKTNTEAAIEAGIALAELDDRVGEISISGVDVPIALVPNGMKVQALKEVIEIADARAEVPRRLRGTSTHTELESFIAHVNRFKDAQSAVFADTSRAQLTAVLNYHAGGDGESPDGDERARWADHRTVYACPLSEQWKLWTSNSGVEMSQEAFGQFIEDNMVDLASPTESDDGLFPKPASVLEMARKLAINLTGEFKREINPTTGESTLVNKTEHGPHSTKIPKAFLLGIPVFEAGALYRVEARLRFTLSSNGPRFAFAASRIQSCSSSPRTAGSSRRGGAGASASFLRSNTPTSTAPVAGSGR